jgi:FHS family L-fucose permease-like MFS transporter
VQQERQPAGVTGAFIIVTCLFFAWGFITALNDPLVAAVKGIFTLTRFEAQFIAFAFFIAYGLISFPAAALLSRTRAMPSIVMALVTMIAGCGLILRHDDRRLWPDPAGGQPRHLSARSGRLIRAREWDHDPSGGG